MKRRCGIIRMDHANTTIFQAFDQSMYRLLVTGNGFRREKEGIPFLELEPTLVALRQLRAGRTALALAAGV
jgi:hypothetical protein